MAVGTNAEMFQTGFNSTVPNFGQNFTEQAQNCKEHEGNYIHVIGTVLSLVIIFENAIVMAALYVDKRKFTKIFFIFIKSLVLSDLLSGVMFLYSFLFNDLLSLSFATTTSSWTVRKSFIIATIIFSLGSLQLITLDRFISVAWPLEHDDVMTRRRARGLVLITWVIGTLFVIIPVAGWNCLQYCVCETSTLDGTPNCPHVLCSRVYPPVTNGYVLMCVVTFFLLASGILFCNVAVFAKIKKHFARMAQSTSAGKTAKDRRDDHRIAIFMAIVFGVFMLCYLPIVILMAIDSTMPDIHISDDLFDFCSMPSLLNSIINPWLYAIKLQSCRSTISRMLCRCVKKEKRQKIFGLTSEIRANSVAMNKQRALSTNLVAKEKRSKDANAPAIQDSRRLTIPDDNRSSNTTSARSSVDEQILN